MLYISELCEDCAVTNEIDYDIDDAWTSIHGSMTTDTWSRRVTYDFNSVLQLHHYDNFGTVIYICLETCLKGNSNTNK